MKFSYDLLFTQLNMGFGIIACSRMLRQKFVHFLDAFMTRLGTLGWGGRFRLAVSLIFYGGGSVFSLWLAYQFRHDFRSWELQPTFWFNLYWMLPIKLLIFFIFRLFDGMLAYFSLPDLMRMGYALLVSFILIFGVRVLGGEELGLNYGIIGLDAIISLGLFSAFRVLFRMGREAVMDYRYQNGNGARRRKVAVIGAGEEGAILVRELLNRPSLGLTPIYILDEEKYRWGSRIHEIPVLGSPEILKEEDVRERVDEVLFSDTSMAPEVLKRIVRMLNQLDIPYRTVTPFLKEGIPGNQPLLKPLDFNDFLRREQAVLDSEGLRHLIEGKVVLVTGAGGSIGSELVRQVALRKPARLVLVERSEVSMFQIQQEVERLNPNLELVVEVADVCQEDRLAGIFARNHPQTVYHAAAHKHVPMMERQPGEALYNNTMGTYRLARQAALHGVNRFVLISTDKAVCPSSVMGATKRLAELTLQYLQQNFPSTRFMMVRFGNVLGSSGSVIPIFENQIKQGGPVTVTHPEVTRYFMTIPEAVGLVLQSSLLGTGGEVFSLDMGKPVRIVELAEQLIEFYGYRPEKDIEIKFTGLRPGEKLHEELSYDSESMESTDHPKVFRIRKSKIPDEQWWNQLVKIIESRHRLERDEIVREMQNLLPEYKSPNSH